MYNLVEISNVRKGYGRNKNVFENLNLAIYPGRIVGLLGPNGSGKTTMIKLLAGLLKEDSGTITIGGYPVGKETKAIVSYLPERTYFNENLKVKNVVQMFKDFYVDFDENKAYQLLYQFQIDYNAVLKTLSKGNKEKVQLILVMSRNASLYLLDEPIAGVDPAARDYILQTILTNYNPNATILISTHLIYDIENVLNDVIFIKDGNIVCYNTADGLRAQMGKSINEIFREVFRC